MKTNNYFDTLNWIYLDTYQEHTIWVKEYIDESKTYLKQVWYDGFVEIVKIG